MQPAYCVERSGLPSNLITPRWPLISLRERGQTDIEKRPWAPVLLHQTNLSIAISIGFVALATRSLILTVGLLATQVLLTVLAYKLPILRRFAHETRVAALNRRAALHREALVAMLPMHHRRELEQLEHMVEHVRMNAGPGPAGSVVERLDELLAEYVDTAIALRAERGSFALTADDRPVVPPPGSNGRSEVARTQLKRLTQLRVRARNRCKERFEALEQQLQAIAELIRLMHEESISDRLSARTQSVQDEVLEELELGQRAHQELDCAGALA